MFAATLVIVSADPPLARARSEHPSATPDASRILGPPEAIAETLVGIARAGFTVLHVGLPGSEDRERFVAEVAPLVRRELGIVPSAGQ